MYSPTKPTSLASKFGSMEILNVATFRVHIIPCFIADASGTR